MNILFGKYQIFIMLNRGGKLNKAKQKGHIV